MVLSNDVWGASLVTARGAIIATLYAGIIFLLGVMPAGAVTLSGPPSTTIDGSFPAGPASNSVVVFMSGASLTGGELLPTMGDTGRQMEQ